MENTFYFMAGLVLLCWPTAWICRGRVRLLPVDALLDDRSLIASWFCTVAWWNLLRGWFGVWLLREAEVGIVGAAARHHFVIGYNGVVLALGLAMQMLFYRTRESQVPFPASYVFGVLLAILPLQVAIPAIILGVATCGAMRSLSFGWASAGLVVCALSLLLAVSKLELAKVGLLFAVPLIGILGSNRHFVLPVGQRSTVPSSRDALESRLR
jgi:hypothetical protein